jgi:putative ABC transport system permease protein
MAIPVVYNLRSVRQRWTSSVVAVLGIAGTVGVFVAMLSLARGFRATVMKSGSEQNALVLRAGATAELMGAVTLSELKAIEDAPGIARGPSGPLISREVVVVATFPLRSSGSPANVQVRGVSPDVFAVRRSAHLVAGRMFTPGLTELIVGRNASRSYQHLGLNDTLRFGGGSWRVVGIFDSGGSAFDSEIWGDARVINQVYHRPENIFQAATVRLTSPAAFREFKNAITSDPRLTVDAMREVDYYEKQSRAVTTLIVVLGSIVAVLMGIGAVFGSLNTMYSAVAERTREIAVMRAIGFGSPSVVLSFMIEALLISLVGGLIGCVAVLPLNGLTTGTVNWQTLSHLAFAFRVTPDLLLAGIGFALFMGLLGGLPPALRAARRPVADALRSL